MDSVSYDLELGYTLALSSPSDDAGTLIRESFEEVRAAEEAGFSWCTIPERHQAPGGSISAPLLHIGALARETRVIRFATSVLIATVHDARHVAEQASMLHHLSNGRFALGLGLGYQEVDLGPFGLESSERMPVFRNFLETYQEAMDTGPARRPATTRSAPYRLAPRPGFLGKPPVWIGAMTMMGVTLAARYADGWISDPIRPIEDVARLAHAYREKCAEVGKSGSVTLLREAWIDTGADSTSRERFEQAIMPLFDYYRRRGASKQDAHFGTSFLDLEKRFVWGPPERCLKRAREFAEFVGADRVILMAKHPTGPPSGEVIDGIREVGSLIVSGT